MLTLTLTEEFKVVVQLVALKRPVFGADSPLCAFTTLVTTTLTEYRKDNHLSSSRCSTQQEAPCNTTEMAIMLLTLDNLVKHNLKNSRLLNIIFKTYNIKLL